MSKIQIPPVLRRATGGERVVEAHGASLAALLEDLYQQFPALGDQLRSDTGLSSHVNIYINGEEARTLQGMDTPISDHDSVILLPAMAGG
jgi:molybdopterin synthase sulfur carrier subunit